MGHLASVVVVNHNGEETLAECVRSIIIQDMPRSDREVIVIDNASDDASIEAVEQHRGIRIIHNERNIGFAPAANQGAEAAEGEFVAFVNSDARLEPRWLPKMIDGMASTKAECVTSKIASWDGKETQYEGGVVSFLGHCWEESPKPKRKGTALLFPHGAALLVRKDVFFSVGGFDPDYFAYFEDVDFGWRMNLLGHRVALVPEAVAYHKGQGTAGRISYAQRLLLYERNALMTIYKNYERANLARVLPAAILLTLSRAFARASLRPEEYGLDGDGNGQPEDLPRVATATLLAVDDFIDRLDQLEERRKAVQENRKRSDQEIFDLLGDPFRVHDMGKIYQQTFETAVDLFGIREVIQT